MQTFSFNREDVKIRLTDEADTNSLALLLAERGFNYPTENSLVGERFSELNRAGDCVLVAVYESKVIGMILLHRTHFLHRQPDGRISSLVVSETF
jgi:predicted N-acetyltransferase YhbS